METNIAAITVFLGRELERCFGKDIFFRSDKLSLLRIAYSNKNELIIQCCFSLFTLYFYLKGRGTVGSRLVVTGALGNPE